jgi:hypothetical protein
MTRPGCGWCTAEGTACPVHADPTPDLFGANVVDRQTAAAELARPKPRQHAHRTGLIGWHWWLTDDNKPAEPVVIHWALTGRTARLRCEAAAIAALEQWHARRRGAES